MRRLKKAFIVLTSIAFVPTAAYAQASITGVVKDTSGAVLPGVTVEASSPGLIEKTRSVVTDGSGQYRVVDLRPGTYTVTFTLTGFNTVKREGIELTGSFTASVDADMRVGTVSETITVTGETPIVDIQSAKRQQTIVTDVITALPTNRAPNSIVGLVPGISVSGSQDVVLNPGPMLLFTAHGGPLNEGRLQVDGLNVGASLNGAGVSGYSADMGNAQEVTFTTSGGLAEAEVGGPFLNIVPRTGGNSLSGSFFAAGANDKFQSSNYTQALKDVGLRVPASLIKLWDTNGALGGAIRKDRVWYFGTGRYIGNITSVPGMYYNKNAGDPTKWTYEADLSQQAKNDGIWKSYALRLTVQATPRNKVNLFWDEQRQCSTCNFGGSATLSPEAAGVSAQRPQRVQQATWTSPVTNRLLLVIDYRV